MIQKDKWVRIIFECLPNSTHQQLHGSWPPPPPPLPLPLSSRPCAWPPNVTRRNWCRSTIGPINWAAITIVSRISPSSFTYKVFAHIICRCRGADTGVPLSHIPDCFDPPPPISDIPYPRFLTPNIPYHRGGSRKLWVGGVEFVWTRAKPLIEGRSAERGVGMGGGVPPPYLEEN